LFKSLKPEF